MLNKKHIGLSVPKLSLDGPVGRQRVKDVYLCEWKTANFGPLRGRNPLCDLHEIRHV